MPPSLSLDEALAGLGARLAGDATMVSLVATDEAGEACINEGWPADVLEEPRPEDFPRVTFYRVPGGEIRRPGLGKVAVRVNLFVWPSGASGGLDRMSAIDSQILALLDEQHFTYGGARLYAKAHDAIDDPAGPGEPRVRVRPIDVFVSPAP